MVFGPIDKPPFILLLFSNVLLCSDYRQSTFSISYCSPIQFLIDAIFFAPAGRVSMNSFPHFSHRFLTSEFLPSVEKV
jgi:hypothetical protein